MNDAKERTFWKDYMHAYEDVFTHTSTKTAPWYIIPADNKWFMRLAVAAITYQTLDDLNLKYPTADQGKEAGAARGAESADGREGLRSAWLSLSVRAFLATVARVAPV